MPHSCAQTSYPVAIASAFRKLSVNIISAARQRRSRLSPTFICTALAALSACLPLAGLNQSAPTLRDTVCWLLLSFVNVCVKPQMEWLHAGKNNREEGSPLGLLSLLAHRRPQSHPPITCSWSCLLSSLSTQLFIHSYICSSIPLSAHHVCGKRRFLWPRTTNGTLVSPWLTPTSLNVNQSYGKVRLSGSWQLPFP